MSDVMLWIIAGTAFAFGAFYSGSETAFIAADRIRLRHLAARGNRKAKSVLSLLDDPEYLLSAVLVGTNLAVTACTATVTALAMRRFGEEGATIATLILVPLFLLFNEIIPKGIFLYYANRVVLVSVDILRGLSFLLYPIIVTFSSFARLVMRLLPEPGDDTEKMQMEDLRYHIRDSREAGLIANETSVLAGRALSLHDLQAKDVMTPLEDVAMLDADDPVDIYAERFAEFGFSRLPMYRGQRSNVVGVMSAHEYVTAGDRESLRDSLGKPYLVQLATPIVDVLIQMREQGQHMALVCHENNHAVGMTTMEDILERFVGAITDEFH